MYKNGKQCFAMVDGGGSIVYEDNACCKGIGESNGHLPLMFLVRCLFGRRKAVKILVKSIVLVFQSWH